MHFLAPAFLFLLLGLPALLLGARAAQDRRHALLRAVVFAFLIVGLARPVRVGEDAREHQVVVLDLSTHDLAASSDQLVELAGLWSAGGESTLVLVGAPAPSDTGAFAHVESIDGARTPGAGTSPLGTALAAAARAIPDGARGAVTLVSDGLATDRRWGPAVQDLTARGIPVHTVSLPGIGEDVRPVGLRPLAPLRRGRTARIEVEVVGSARSLDLSLTGPRGELARRNGIACDGRTVAVLEFEPDATGYLPLEVAIENVDGVNPIPENDARRRNVAVNEPFQVLYLGERIAGGRDQLASLVGAGFEVNGWTDATLDAERLAADYDLVVLDDLPAARLGAPNQEAIRTAVEDSGLGLFVSGGQAAFGPGGYHREPLEAVLPVEFLQKEEKRDPSTTLVVIIDTSGSMGGNRVQLAKEVARLSIRRLLPHDKVGIVEFYGAKRWAAPIQPASNAIELERALNRLDAGGGTVILPAIEEAFYGLKNVQTRYKHVLVLTDGGVETGAFEPLLRSMADDGINVSTVLIGPEAHSEFLVTLANWGKGRFYAVPNRFNLPEILLKQPASAKLPAYRPGVHAVHARGGTGWWGPADVRAIPALAGYVETRERPGSETLLETDEGASPVLSTWRYGLGRVTAFTSEPTGPGTRPWRDWGEYGRWLARVLERTASDQRAAYRFAIERDGSWITVRATRRRPLVDPPHAVLDGDDATGEALAFRERAPGVFEACFFADSTREVRVLAHAGSNAAASPRTRLVSSPAADVAPELQVDPAQGLDLTALAQATGGSHRLLDAAADFSPTAGGGDRALALTPLWPWFVFLALLAYLGDIAYRRRPGRDLS